jgi:hypothetical protein
MSGLNGPSGPTSKSCGELIGAEAVEDMTFTRLEQLVQDMKARGYQPATVKRKLAMLARALKMATMWPDEKGQPLLRYKPPLPFIKVDNLKDRIITPDRGGGAVRRAREAPAARARPPVVRLPGVPHRGLRHRRPPQRGPRPRPQAHRPPAGDQVVSYLTFPRYRTKSGKPRTLPLAAALGRPHSVR